jgi:hypothetical protein
VLPKIWPPSFALNKTVNVPFGSFKNCLETEEFTPLEPGVLDHKFYAPWYWIHSIRRAQRRSGTPRTGDHCAESMNRRGSSTRVDSSSTNTLSFSSGRTMKRFPSPRWASAIHIFRPLESIAETQPKLQPALLRY